MVFHLWNSHISTSYISSTNSVICGFIGAPAVLVQKINFFRPTAYLQAVPHWPVFIFDESLQNDKRLWKIAKWVRTYLITGRQTACLPCIGHGTLCTQRWDEFEAESTIRAYETSLASPSKVYEGNYNVTTPDPNDSQGNQWICGYALYTVLPSSLRNFESVSLTFLSKRKAPGTFGEAAKERNTLFWRKK